MSSGGSDTHAELKIGRTLARTRRERGLSLKEVEEATKIRAAYLAELEQGNFDVLPAVYARGSLKTYANFLQLDGDALVRELKRRRAAAEEPRDPAPAGPPEIDPIDRRAAVLAGAAGGGGAAPLEDREEPGKRALPAGISGYLALGFAALVVLALVAAVLASTLAWQEEPAVSKVNEPLIARAPEASSVVEDEPPAPPPSQEDARGQDDDGPDDGDDPGSAPPVVRDGADERAALPTARTRPAPARVARGAISPRQARTEPRTRRTPPEADFTPAPRGAAATAPAPSSSPPAPPAGALAPQGGTVPATNAPAPVTGAPSGGFQVRVEVGGDDPVQITGDPTGP